MTTFLYQLRYLVLFLIGCTLPLSASAQYTDLQDVRPHSQYGVNVFEPPQADTVEYDGFEVDWGAAFTQQFQALSQSNSAQAPDLPELGPGFNLATANLYLGAQLAEGITVNLTTYLSSRHHPEAWVKGGYLQVDELPITDNPALSSLMDYVTLRVGHFEVNYGDAHFRRTDNGNALYNPFVGNYILDSFTTEIGGEVYLRSPGGLLGMVGITGGEINGGVTSPDDRAPSFYGKVGFDRQINEALRLRLTGSAYTTTASQNNTLHSGDRAGSRYYSVMGEGDWSGRIRSGFSDAVTSFMVNPFIEFKGLELFGTIEQVSGSRAGLSDGSLDQYAVEGVYRFANEDLFVGARYNTMSGDLDISGFGEEPNWVDVGVDRWQISGGWFVTPNVLAKVEYMAQSYDDYPSATVFHEGEFSGLMIEGIVMF